MRTGTRPGGEGAGGANPHAIQGVRLTPAGMIDPADLAYAVLEGDAWSPPVAGGRFCGTVGQSRALRGVSITLRGRAAERFALRYEARFADGAVRAAPAGRPLSGRAPLVDLRIAIRPR